MASVFIDCNHKYDNKLSDIINIQTNIKHYLRNITVPNIILAKSFETTKCNYFDSVYADIKIALGTLSKEIVGDLSQEKWEECKGDCFTIITKYVNQELKSTAYMMRLLDASTIGDGWKTNKLEFVFEDSNITGKWATDKTLVKLNVSSSSSPRLIMGFGPSASGKTYCAGEVIKLMQSVEGPSFPDLFLSIDGGIYRECSVMYQLILNALKETTNLKGLKNLVYAGFHISDSIFDSGKIKKSVMAYLEEQKRNGVQFSLYVPETLGKCMSLRKVVGFDTTCRSIYKEYIDYTDDQDWVGLMIWQHKTGDDCDKDDAHKCKGCKESGTSREESEGKKYSSSAWENSYQYGLIASKSAPHYRFIIHNTGGRKHTDASGPVPNIITFDDYSDVALDVQQKIEDHVKSISWNYVQKVVNKEFQSYETIKTNLKLAEALYEVLKKTKASKEEAEKEKEVKESKIKAKKEAIKKARTKAKEVTSGGSPYDAYLNTLFNTYKVDKSIQHALRTLYDETKSDPTIRFDTDDNEIEGLTKFTRLIFEYINKYKPTIASYTLLKMSFDILAGLHAKKPTEDEITRKLLDIGVGILAGLYTKKPTEVDHTKKLLTMGFDILAKLDKKPWSFKFPELPAFPDILPEQSVRQSDIMTTIDDVTDDINNHREITDRIITTYKDDPYKPLYYEHEIQQNESAEELKAGLKTFTEKIDEERAKLK